MTKNFLCIFAAALFATAVPLSAATITQTANLSGIPSMSGSGAFNQFNTGLGTLTSVQIGFSLQISGGQLRLDNESNSPASGTFEFGAKGTLNSTDVILLNTSFLPVPGQVSTYNSSAFSLAANVGDIDGDYDPAPPDGLLYDGSIQNDSNSGYIANALWTAGTKGFLGTGTYNINYDIFQWLDYGGFGGIEHAVSPFNANGCITVVYNYVVPEPATISLFCAGIFALLKRKNSKY